jgi:hypothetical protein
LAAVRVHAPFAANLGHVLAILADCLAAFLRDLALLVLIHGGEASRSVVVVPHFEPPEFLEFRVLAIL